MSQFPILLISIATVIGNTALIAVAAICSIINPDSILPTTAPPTVSVIDTAEVRVANGKGASTRLVAGEVSDRIEVFDKGFSATVEPGHVVLKSVTANVIEKFALPIRYWRFGL